MVIYKIIKKIQYIIQCWIIRQEKKKLGYCGKRVKIEFPNTLNNKMFLYDDVYIYGGAKFIIGGGGKYIMKHHAGASQNLTVITGKHGKSIGHWFHDIMWTGEKDEETTIVVEEDVQIGANVTLMPGVTVGRGAQIGACSVVTKDIPPYAIAAGCPAKILKFHFTPEEIIEHEKVLFQPNERFSLNELIKMQNKD